MDFKKIRNKLAYVKVQLTSYQLILDKLGLDVVQQIMKVFIWSVLISLNSQLIVIITCLFQYCTGSIKGMDINSTIVPTLPQE